MNGSGSLVKLGGSRAVVQGGTLAGIGSISVPVAVSPGGTLSPAGDAIGTFSVGTGTFGLTGDFSYTNAFNTGTPQQFFRLLQ